MVSMRQIEEQLKHVGCNFKVWGRSEVRELCNVLMPEEKIAQAVNGSYEGGFAMLCVTNYRVLLIDRKPMLLTIEDVRYDMIAEVDYHNRLLGGTVRVFTPMRTLVFSTWSVPRLRKSVNYIQQRVMELRQHGLTAQQLLGQTVGNAIGPRFNLPASSQQRSATSQNQGRVPYTPMNPYTKTPMLTRRRRFPSFY